MRHEGAGEQGSKGELELDSSTFDTRSSTFDTDSFTSEPQSFQCPIPDTSLREAAPTASPNSWRGCTLSVAMPQALRPRSGQAQYKCPMPQSRYILWKFLKYQDP
ncbi:MAG: hypothetical protein V7K21_28345 [Nostoc sp.]|uniref:hypothetical protein n=1 Tax=Nostoc sp. TaxID=1180 RepID=UPI002FF687FB